MEPLSQKLSLMFLMLNLLISYLMRILNSSSFSLNNKIQSIDSLVFLLLIILNFMSKILSKRNLLESVHNQARICLFGN